MALLVVPCGDHFHPSDITSSFHHENQDHDKENGNLGHVCSPFCVCGCCQMAISDQVTYQIEFTIIEVLKYHSIQSNTYYQINYSQDYLHSIFQPPRSLA